jgi:hypothetical protein
LSRVGVQFSGIMRLGFFAHGSRLR